MVGIDQQQRKLFASVARHHVVDAPMLTNQPGHSTEHVVTGLVTKAIVVQAEVIDIDHQHAQRNPGAQRALHL